MAKMIFAREIDSGKIIGIDEVENGLSCHCECISCGAKVEARQGEVREHHFSHHGTGDNMACYSTALMIATKESLERSTEICLPELNLNTKDGREIVVPNDFVFEYDNVRIIDTYKFRNNAFSVLALLSDDKGRSLEVLICTESNGYEKLCINPKCSRLAVFINNISILTIDEFKRVLTKETFNKEWIYNRKKEEKSARYKLEASRKVECNPNELSDVKNEIEIKKQSNIYNKSFDPKGVYEKRMLEIQDTGIKEYLPQGKCPYCYNDLHLRNGRIECGVLCPFKADLDWANKNIIFTKKYGDKNLTVIPIPKKFL